MELRLVTCIAVVCRFDFSQQMFRIGWFPHRFEMSNSSALY